jgi:hypothetical protein
MVWQEPLLPQWSLEIYAMTTPYEHQPAQPVYAQQWQPPAPPVKKRPPWLIPVIIVGAMIALCCVGGLVAVVINASGSDDEPEAVATDDTREEPPAASEPSQEAEPAAEETQDSQTESFGDGVWEIDTELDPGTYVTVAPEDGFGCYWARLSGFSGDFEEIIANGNLEVGARGRVTIEEGDAGIELSGGCEWANIDNAPEVSPSDSTGDGVWEIGTEVEPGTYTTTAPEDSLGCYWARLSGFSGEFDDIIANGNLDAGARGRVEVSDSDTGIEFSGTCTWTRS